ncbi:response regulator transcription factor [Winogradskyella psychrotolerans]|uniref:response regulator transcription factor n=1 Tax=Winogradskyella psychrotolerans TaxID=1344585 RepID=UPI00339D47A5
MKLSDLEVDVLEQMSKGLSYNAIADNLVLSTGPIRKYIENIYRKLQLHNKLEAVQKARRNNLF